MGRTNTPKHKGKGFRGDPEANKRYIYSALRKDGFTHAAATGIVGNILVETGNFKYVEEITPNINNQRGLGILQWSGSRANDFRAWLKKTGNDIQDIKANVNYMLMEMKKKSRHHWSNGMSYDSMKKMENVDEATKSFMSGYLRPHKDSTHIDKRLAWAHQYDPVFKGEEKPESRIVDAHELETDDIVASVDERRNAEQRAENIVSTIDIGDSTMSPEDMKKVKEATAGFMTKGRVPENKKTDPYFRIAQKAFRSTPKGILNKDLVGLGIKRKADTTKEEESTEDTELTPTDLDMALGGYLQPNGRKTEFTRAEDIVAQNKTSYEPS